MRDKAWILIGLVIGLGLLTFPIWYNSAAGTDSARPELKKAVEGSECIYGTEYMRANHMDVLMDWRDEVVRNDNRFVEIGGKKVEMSLSRTCMGCHANTEQFCTKCHDYAGVDPYCWDCHVRPEDATHLSAEARVHREPSSTAEELP